jgi:hypothetical protein
MSRQKETKLWVDPFNVFNTQLLTRTDNYDEEPSCTTFSDSTGGPPWLDTSFVFNGIFPYNFGYSLCMDLFGDAPTLKDIPCTEINFNQNNKVYMLFQPTTPGSIPVTLQTTTWSVTAGAKPLNGIWTLTSGSGVTAPQFNPGDDTFPTWTQVY